MFHFAFGYIQYLPLEFLAASLIMPFFSAHSLSSKTMGVTNNNDDGSVSRSIM